MTDQSAKMTTLRDLARSDRHFWQPTAREQVAFSAVDIDINSYKRQLPENETLTMALNEVSYARREGYFFYLPTREAKTNDDESLLPRSRAAPTGGALYPTLMFMPFVWDDVARSGFSEETHRGRYLKSSALINRPPPQTPLYAIQHIGHARMPVYGTPIESLIILATEDSYYLMPTREYGQIVGWWDKKYKASGFDPEWRFNQAPFMWKNPSDEASILKKQDMQKFRQDTTEALYDSIVRACTPFGGIPSTFTAAQLTFVIPRPAQPEPGIALGLTPEGTAVTTSAEPTSRRGISKKRKPTAATSGEGDEEEDEETA